MLTVGIQEIDTPVDVVVPEETYAGGMYYTVLVFGGGTAAAPMDARVAATGSRSKRPVCPVRVA